MQNSWIMSYVILITIYMIQRATLRSAAISVVLISLSASFVAKIVRSLSRTHQVSATACTSAQDAMQKDALVAVGGLWNRCSAGPCKSCMGITIGLCEHLEVLMLSHLTKSETSKSYRSPAAYIFSFLFRIIGAS